MAIEEQGEKKKRQAVLPHEWQVFEQVLSKPFFLANVHKALMVNPQKSISAK